MGFYSHMHFLRIKSINVEASKLAAIFAKMNFKIFYFVIMES
jgi:hypothetical protein